MYNGVQSNKEAIELLERAADRADAMLEMAKLTTTDARAIARLLKDQDKRYKEMVVEWLREMARNNYQEVNFLDAILDIRERAMIGLENYFKNYKKDKAVKWNE